MRPSLRSLAVGIALVACSSPAWAVVVHPGNDNSSGLDKPPVNVVGQWAGNASAVAIAPNFALTAAHPSLGGGNIFVRFGGVSYLVAQITQHPTADLRVARLEALGGGPANLTDFVPIYDANADGSEVGKTAVIGGFGRGRGAELSAGGTPYGYAWDNSTNDTLRWGANRVDNVQANFNTGAPFNFVSDILVDDFDQAGAASAVSFEAASAAFDSGGGWFIKVGTTWKVAALTAYTSHNGESWYRDNLNTGAVEPPDLNAGVRLTPYIGFINQVIPPATVMGRHVFYNRSRFDNNDPAITAGDDAAVAPDKLPLLPGGTATSANYTSYSRGLNGIMIDVADLRDASGIGVDDFAFKFGNSDNPAAWGAAPSPSSILVREGAGAGGSDRIELVWNDGAIAKTWLQIILLANDDTGLAADDVFYFGNAIGEAADSADNALVNASDEILARVNARNIFDPAPIDFLYDYNRDQLVNATDQIISRTNASNIATALLLINVPESPVAAHVPVPEPATILLAILGLAALPLAAWRRT